MRIEPEIISVLESAKSEQNRLFLVGQLDRKTYEKANKVLEAIGGKWDRKARAHVFPDLVADVLDPILLTGEYSRTKQDFGQFDTPPDLAAEIVARAKIEPGMRVLEPSAGIGNLARAINAAGGRVGAFEIDDKRRAILEAAGFPAQSGDFLEYEACPEFDRVVMNPPFAKQADIDHVLHAWRWLKPTGKLVAIMSGSVAFRTNLKTKEFRDCIQAFGGTIVTLPESSFASSGTHVNTVVVEVAGSRAS